ncbi:MAG: hypothetical protein ACU84H_07170 [Gammaproteobacteria bacterium]
MKKIFSWFPHSAWERKPGRTRLPNHRAIQAEFSRRAHFQKSKREWWPHFDAAIALLLACFSMPIQAEETYPVDLDTVLKLAGARNLTI